MGLGQPQITGNIGKEALRLGIKDTKTLYLSISMAYRDWGMVGTINIHLVHILDTHRTIEDY